MQLSAGDPEDVVNKGKLIFKHDISRNPGASSAKQTCHGSAADGPQAKASKSEQTKMPNGLHVCFLVCLCGFQGALATL